MKRERQNQRNGWAISGLVLATLLAGCGSSTTTTTTGTPTATTTSTPAPVIPTTTTTSTTSGNTSNLLPAIDASFSLAGTRGATTTAGTTYSITVNTDNVLQVTVQAGTAGSLTVPGYGFSASYGCVNYKVTVLGDTVVTQTLSTGSSTDDLDCPGAPTSQMLDFSSRLTPGHGPITVTVASDQYDFDCQSCETYPSLYDYDCTNYCPLDLVYKNHTVTGTLSIATNGNGA